MYREEKEVLPSEVYYTGWKKMDNKERGQREV
jgi:hypothetical protein